MGVGGKEQRKKPRKKEKESKEQTRKIIGICEGKGGPHHSLVEVFL